MTDVENDRDAYEPDDPKSPGYLDRLIEKQDDVAVARYAGRPQHARKKR